ncbi:MAG: ABC transporter ATP-binding protein [Chromatiales bacterium]|mgnify:FL=1|nr:ABC transporter ATP-binding protein [Chromatiales bacterium]
MADLALAVSQLSRRYDNRQILDHLDLSVAPGELVAIVGESGSGKSTLLNLIAGLDQPDAGRITIGGQDLATLDDDACTRLRRARLGFVFQSFHILPHLRIGQNIELPLVLLGVAAGERQQRVAELLDAVGLADRAGSLPRELSGGELQRVAVARALVHRPLLILADEPTGNLDAETAATLMKLLATQIRERGAAGVLVTHSAAAAALADRVLLLSQGRLHPQGPAAH